MCFGDNAGVAPGAAASVRLVTSASSRVALANTCQRVVTFPLAPSSMPRLRWLPVWIVCEGSCGSGAEVFVYTKPGHTPASFTVLNFPVPHIEAAVDGLTARGVTFQRYEGMPFDERGIMIGCGPPIAWFTDPAGNVVDAVSYDDGIFWPDEAGKSLNLSRSQIDAGLNDDGGNWCSALSAFPGGFDFGTPRLANNNCP